ncbi:TPA_asm: P3 [Betula betacytorhabdovirus 2]|nr:TPA_asm: P3 [Betula betacytorhabdovirus 2]
MDTLDLYNPKKNTHDKKKKITKKGSKEELIQESVTIFQPIAMPYIWIREILDKLARVVKYEKLAIHYHTYMRNLTGLISVRIIDTRSTDLKAKVLLYTVFQANQNQYFEIGLNVAVGPLEKEDPLKIYIMTHELSVAPAVNYGNLKIRPSWVCSKKDLSSDPVTFKSTPKISWCRGVDVNDEDIHKIHSGSILTFN